MENWSIITVIEWLALRIGKHFIFFPHGWNSWDNTGISSDLPIIQASSMYQVSKTELGLDIYSIKHWIANLWNSSYVQKNKSHDTGTLPLLAPDLLEQLLKDGHLKSVFHDSSHRI